MKHWRRASLVRPRLEFEFELAFAAHDAPRSPGMELEFELAVAAQRTKRSLLVGEGAFAIQHCSSSQRAVPSAVSPESSAWVREPLVPVGR